MMMEFVIYHHPNVPDIYRVAPIHLQNDLRSTIYLRLYILIVHFIPKSCYSKIAENGWPICLWQTKLPGRVDGAIKSNDLCAWRIGFSGFKCYLHVCQASIVTRHENDPLV
jgi:hypothetical protein